MVSAAIRPNRGVFGLVVGNIGQESLVGAAENVLFCSKRQG
jgi:hypothetical protein